MKFEYEMTYREKIAGPWGPTTGSPFGTRLLWSVVEASLTGNRIEASLAMPGADWIRMGADGLRRQDQRLTFTDGDGSVILLSYDNALIRPNDAFTRALSEGTTTTFDDVHVRMVAQFDTGDDKYSWLTQSLFIGEGRVAGDREIEYRIYRVD